VTSLIAASGAICGAGVLIVASPGLLSRGRIFVESLVVSSRVALDLRTSNAHATDLAVVGWTTTDLVVRQLSGIVIGFAGAALPIGLLGTWTASVAAGIGGGALGFVTPVLSLRSRARTRRRAFVNAFSAYLDLVNVLLAGGAGVETALTAAADAGDGWTFAALRGCIARSRLARRSPWSELRTLGQRWGIQEVEEVAGSMSLSGEHGARIRTSLAARAESMRMRQVAEVEASAQSATERMGVPMMLLFVGFIVLLGYPALQTMVINM